MNGYPKAIGTVPENRTEITRDTALNGPASNRHRSEILAFPIKEAERVLGQCLTGEVFDAFIADLKGLIGRDAEWVESKIARVRSGRGITQETYARLVLVLLRLPGASELVWRYGPKNGAVISIVYPVFSDGGRKFCRYWPAQPRRESERLSTPLDVAPKHPQFKLVKVAT